MATRQLLSKCRTVLNKCRDVTVKVPWGTVNGIEFGPRDAPPVLMVHGWLDNCYSFVPLLTQLPLNRRYIALDLPGHGHSSHKPASSYNFTLNSVLDMEQIRRGLGVDKMTLIGHSLGAIISILYSATYPEHVTRTVAIDSIFPRVQETADGNVVNILRKASEDHINDSYRRSGQFHDKGSLGHAWNCPRVFPDIEVLAKVKSESPWYLGLDADLSKLIIERNTIECEGGIKQKYDPKMRYTSVMYLSRDEYMEFLKALQNPVLYIEAGEGLTKALPRLKGIEKVVTALNSNVGHVLIPGPHHVHMSNPEQTAQVVDEFILHGNSKP